MISRFMGEVDGINFIDIGSSGCLNAKWKTLEPLIRLTGFDPNKEECERMAALPHQFKSLRYLPYALGDKDGENVLFKTKSIYCYSLLKPNNEWLSRFSFGDLFEIIGNEKINTVKLSDLEELQENDTDIIKIDTQGMELPILSNAGSMLDKCFFIETETGFLQNYIGETTYAEIDFFMRANGFFLFDINTTHRVARNNVFKDQPTGKEQILWCEATWMKDYITLINKGEIDAKTITRNKALKVLVICALQGCIDYGYELAILFENLGLLENKELKELTEKKNWLLIAEQEKINLKQSDTIKFSLLNMVLRLLPLSMRKAISNQALIAITQKHLFNF